MAKTKSTNNDIQNITQITKDRATWTPLKFVSELKCSWRVSSFCSTCGTPRGICCKKHDYRLCDIFDISWHLSIIYYPINFSPFNFLLRNHFESKYSATYILNPTIWHILDLFMCTILFCFGFFPRNSLILKYIII